VPVEMSATAGTLQCKAAAFLGSDCERSVAVEGESWRSGRHRSAPPCVGERLPATASLKCFSAPEIPFGTAQPDSGHWAKARWPSAVHSDPQ
jgi:hypothetical protein